VNEEQGDKVHQLRQEIRKWKLANNYSWIQLAKLLKQVRDEKLYKDFGHKSFASFLSDPQVGLKRSTVYLYIDLYKSFCEKAKYGEHDIVDVDLARLRAIASVCKSGASVAEWLDKARTLGGKDFIDEIRLARGLSPMATLAPVPDEQEQHHDPNSGYARRVHVSACCVCGVRPVDGHHFPTTHGAAGYLNERIIPLCRGCHTQFHQSPKDFLWEYREQIFNWFYTLMGV